MIQINMQVTINHEKEGCYYALIFLNINQYDDVSSISLWFLLDSQRNIKWPFVFQFVTEREAMHVL